MVDEDVREMAARLAGEAGLSLGAVVNMALKRGLPPLTAALSQSPEEDRPEGSQIAFAGLRALIAEGDEARRQALTREEEERQKIRTVTQQLPGEPGSGIRRST
jgi:hypothetical protein